MRPTYTIRCKCGINRMPHQRSPEKYLERYHKRYVKWQQKLKQRKVSRQFGTTPENVKNFDAPHLKQKKFSIINNLTKRRNIDPQLRDSLIFQAKRCPICGWGEKYPEALIIHHKDRNRQNNDLSNLIVLCRNCHCLVHLGLKECP